MKNLWIQTDHAFATWIADLTALADRPAAMLDVVCAALEAGARHRVFEVLEAPVIGYRRDEDGALAPRLRGALARDQVLDLFGFTGAAMMPGHPRSSTVEATIAYYDAGERIVERAVRDPGELLASLEPAPGSIPRSCMRRYPAVRITGRRYAEVGRLARVDHSRHPLPVAALIALHSDLWFPWVFGSAHPDADHRRMFDNRELARRHTPRLNAFLREIAAAVRGAGGRFAVHADETATWGRDWIDDDGVRLDWQPAHVMPQEALAAEWF
jgi:hypothetical protein